MSMLVCLSFLLMPTYPCVCFPGEGACQPSCHHRPSIHPMCQWLRFILASRQLCVNTDGVTTVRFVSLSWSVCSVSVEKKKRRRGVGKQREWNLHVLGSVLWILYLAVLFCSFPIIHVAFNWPVQSNSICATALPAENNNQARPQIHTFGKPRVQNALSTSYHIALNPSPSNMLKC